MVDLTAKAGPLPVYAWGGIIGAGVIGYYYWERNKAGSVATTDSTGGTGIVSDPGSDSLDTNSVVDGAGAAVGYPVLGSGNTSSTSSSTEPYATYDPTEFYITPIGATAAPIVATPVTTPTLPTTTPRPIVITEPFTHPVVTPVAAPKPTPVTTKPAPTKAPTPAVVPTPRPGAAPAKTYYTVVRGDTLSGIAAKHHMTLAKLLELNPTYKAHPNNVSVGAKIRIT